ncbi:MAG TPA: hypothetical protein VGG12_01185 [Methylovirgula sp.]
MTSALHSTFHTAPSNIEGLRLALQSGGDERVLIDPATGRTKYGTLPSVAENEIWFSSSTASTISPRGEAAAADLWRGLISGSQSLEEACDAIRHRLLGLFGTEGTEAILTGSGTEAILISAILARATLGNKITTILVGSSETGRGVAKAAAGRHFVTQAAFGAVTQGEALTGLSDFDCRIESVEIRDAEGALRSADEIEAELTQKADAARRDNRGVLVHRLDVSKTGQSAPSLDVLAELHDRWPDHLLILADCCQLRCAPSHLRALLARGFFVALTGSKFAGGPTFCGALLVPEQLNHRLRGKDTPNGLAAYSAQWDWAASLRTNMALDFLPASNMGLALRWEAALAEIETFVAWPSRLRNAIMLRFYEEVARRAASASDLELLGPSSANSESFGYTITSLRMRDGDGRPLDMSHAAAVQKRLRGGADTDGQRFHLGQPVEIGAAGVLRVCASAPLVNRIADKMQTGMALADAFAPIREEIAELFHTWRGILGRDFK